MARKCMETFEKIDRGIIESFSVLKDSASIGLYGKRGANGVILVTTRREGKTRVQDISTFTEIKATETNTVPDFLVAGIVTDEQGQPKAELKHSRSQYNYWRNNRCKWPLSSENTEG